VADCVSRIEIEGPTSTSGLFEAAKQNLAKVQQWGLVELMSRGWPWIAGAGVLAGLVLAIAVLAITQRGGEKFPTPTGEMSAPRLHPSAARAEARPDPVQAMAAMARAEVAFAAEPHDVSPEWRRAIDEALGTPGGAEAMASALAALLPRLPDEAREEAVFEMVALLSDENYGPARKLLLNPATSAAVFAVALEDLARRPESLRLPLLAQIAMQHPQRAGVLELLRAALPQAAGGIVLAWPEVVSAHLARQRAEEDRP